MKIGTTAFSFDKWEAEIETKTPEITNFTSGGFQALVASITKATITCEGPYNEGNMPWTSGNSYTLILGYSNTINLTVTALLQKIKPAVKVDDADRLSLTFGSTGVFTAATL